MLKVAPNQFMQYSGPMRLRPTYKLEYKNGSTDGLYQAVADHITKEQILSVLLRYLGGDTSWQSEFRWEKLKLPQGIPPKRPEVTRPLVAPTERVSWIPSLAKATTFLERYRIVLEGLHGPIPFGSGFLEEEIAFAEEKLALRMPTALRDFYLWAGRFEPVTQALNRFYPP